MEAGLNASLELQCRKTMEIRTKHVRAGFAAGLEGLKAMEIGAKQYDKEGALFWTSKILGLQRFEPQQGLAWPRLASPRLLQACINIIERENIDQDKRYKRLVFGFVFLKQN